MQPIRIQKALSEAGVASRRAAEELVRQGRVTINGRKAEIGQSVNPDRDVIAVDGKRVYFARKKQYRYIMMNKPRGYVTTLSDELGRRCVTDLLTGVEERVYPIGRLDRNSEGLLLFTNDGELANRIMHPASHINKVYRVTVRPDITDEQAEAAADRAASYAPSEGAVLSVNGKSGAVRLNALDVWALPRPVSPKVGQLVRVVKVDASTGALTVDTISTDSLSGLGSKEKELLLKLLGSVSYTDSSAKNALEALKKLWDTTPPTPLPEPDIIPVQKVALSQHTLELPRLSSAMVQLSTLL